MTDTEFQIRVSYNYHKKRERFFRLNDAGSKFLSIVALTALASIGGVVGVTIAVFSGAATILSVVLDFSGMASKHESLANEYLALLSRLTAGEVTEADAAKNCRAIGVKEPTVLRGLAQLCQDEEEAARRDDVEMDRLSWNRRLAAHFGFGERPVTWSHQQDDPA